MRNTNSCGHVAASNISIFSECSLRAALVENTIRFPSAAPLPQDYRNIPYFVPGVDAFPLRPWLMKPYSMKGMTNEQRVFNFRQSRARRVVENIFGIMVHRWRCLSTMMHCSPASANRGCNVAQLDAHESPCA